MKIELTQGKIKLVMVDYGRGKYYSYIKNGKRHQIIEMNEDMFHFDKELFYWVLEHEREHLLFYTDLRKEGLGNPKVDMMQGMPTGRNIKNVMKLRKFEQRYKIEVNHKDFAVSKFPEFIDSDEEVHYYSAFSRDKKSRDNRDYFEITEKDINEICQFLALW